MPVASYALRRLAQILPVALLVTVLIFLLIKLIPGDPAAAILGERASDAAIRALHQQWGLDRPLWQQYAIYMRNLVTGNLDKAEKVDLKAVGEQMRDSLSPEGGSDGYGSDAGYGADEQKAPEVPAPGADAASPAAPAAEGSDAGPSDDPMKAMQDALKQGEQKAKP